MTPRQKILSRKIKKSELFLCLCLAFIAGIAIRSCFPISLFAAYLVFLSGLAALALGWKKDWVRAAGLCILAVALGILRYGLSIPESSEGKVQFYNQEKVSFAGIVSDEPDIRQTYINLTVEAQSLERNGRSAEISGKVLVRANRYPEYEYGDRLEIACELQEPKSFDDFDYGQYLARYGIYSLCYYPKITLVSQCHGNILYRYVLKAKGKLEEVISRGLPDPEAGLLSAISLGLKHNISDDLLAAFSVAGLSHIIAISGLHIVILSVILSSLANGLSLSRRKAFYFTLVFLALFIVMTGAHPSAIRAGIMGALAMLAERIGRPRRAVNIVVFAACLMLLANPKILAADVGFQLSFAAVMGLIYIAPLVRKYLKKIPNFRHFEIRSYLIMTFSAQIATYPLIAYHFGQLSFLSPIANILVVPALPFLMILGFSAQWLGLLWLPLAKFLFFPAWIILKYVIVVAGTISLIPFAAAKVGSVPLWAATAAYLPIFLWVIAARRNENNTTSKRAEKK